MANIKLIDDLSPSTPSTTVGTPVTMDGGRVVIHITATDFGTDGRVIIKASADGTIFTTLVDASTSSGFAEYSADIIINVDKIAQGWKIRADFDIQNGTATDVTVIMGTN